MNSVSENKIIESIIKDRMEKKDGNPRVSVSLDHAIGVATLTRSLLLQYGSDSKNQFLGVVASLLHNLEPTENPEMNSALALSYLEKKYLYSETMTRSDKNQVSATITCNGNKANIKTAMQALFVLADQTCMEQDKMNVWRTKDPENHSLIGIQLSITQKPRPSFVTHLLSVSDDPAVLNEISEYVHLISSFGESLNMGVLFSINNQVINYDAVEIEESHRHGRAS